jgi:hypothetical protein
VESRLARKAGIVKAFDGYDAALLGALVITLGVYAAAAHEGDAQPTREELGAMLVAADDYIEELEYELSQGCEHVGE